MEPFSPRRAELLGSTIRRLLRRGARSRISKMVARERPEDIAQVMGRLTPADQREFFQTLVTDFAESASTVLTSLEPPQRAAILEWLAPEQTARLLEAAAIDDAVFLVDSLPEELKEKVLEIVDLDDKLTEVHDHLTYGDDSAGRIMNSEFLALEEEITVGEAIEKVRSTARDVEMISYLYVIDAGGRLLGVTSLRQLLLSDPESTLGAIMNTSVIQVVTDTDQEEVAKMAARYDLLAIPVTDAQNTLMGIVTVDDILDVFKDEATEDFFKLAGTSDDELVYQDHSFKVAGIRLPWLVVNLIGLLVAGIITTRFDETFEIALLVGFIPVIMGMGGNIGSQTSTITVRGLATGRISPASGIARFVWQQVKVGLVLAVTCATIVGIVCAVIEGGFHIPIAVGLSLFVVVLLASLNGVLVPVVFERLGIDPAVASGPLVTTTNDILGILVYFGFATLLLRLLA